MCYIVVSHEQSGHFHIHEWTWWQIAFLKQYPASHLKENLLLRDSPEIISGFQGGYWFWGSILLGRPGEVTMQEANLNRWSPHSFSSLFLLSYLPLPPTYDTNQTRRHPKPSTSFSSSLNPARILPLNIEKSSMNPGHPYFFSYVFIWLYQS